MSGGSLLHTGGLVSSAVLLLSWLANHLVFRIPLSPTAQMRFHLMLSTFVSAIATTLYCHNFTSLAYSGALMYLSVYVNILMMSQLLEYLNYELPNISYIPQSSLNSLLETKVLLYGFFEASYKDYRLGIILLATMCIVHCIGLLYKSIKISYATPSKYASFYTREHNTLPISYNITGLQPLFLLSDLFSLFPKLPIGITTGMTALMLTVMSYLTLNIDELNTKLLKSRAYLIGIRALNTSKFLSKIRIYICIINVVYLTGLHIISEILSLTAHINLKGILIWLAFILRSYEFIYEDLFFIYNKKYF
jgi:hypothetical protein